MWVTRNREMSARLRPTAPSAFSNCRCASCTAQPEDWTEPGAFEVVTGVHRIPQPVGRQRQRDSVHPRDDLERARLGPVLRLRSEEHTSELQSRRDLVCRLLL